MSISKQESFVHASIYPSGDLEVKMRGTRLQTGRGIRGEISKLSSASAKRCLTVFRALSEKFKVMVTLTYPAEYRGLLDGKTSKKHLHRFIDWLQVKLGKELVYAWVLEFQKNGNPHYHLLLSHQVEWKDVAFEWFKIVGSGLEKHLEAGTRVEAILSGLACSDYVGRYLGKVKQKDVPEGFQNVGRFWGYRRGSVEKVDVEMVYPDRESAKRDTRLIRKARKAALRGHGIKWKWRGSGFTARELGVNLAFRLVDMMKGDLVEEVPW